MDQMEHIKTYQNNKRSHERKAQSLLGGMAISQQPSHSLFPSRYRGVNTLKSRGFMPLGRICSDICWIWRNGHGFWDGFWCWFVALNLVMWRENYYHLKQFDGPHNKGHLRWGSEGRIHLIWALRIPHLVHRLLQPNPDQDILIFSISPYIGCNDSICLLPKSHLFTSLPSVASTIYLFLVHSPCSLSWTP